MNNSQLLYKISNLEYSIRMKEAEYIKAKNAGDKESMDLHAASLKLLKQDIAAAKNAFNSVPAVDVPKSSGVVKKARWWQSIFKLS